LSDRYTNKATTSWRAVSRALTRHAICRAVFSPPITYASSTAMIEMTISISTSVKQARLYGARLEA
jgi:hypothetical protein